MVTMSDVLLGLIFAPVLGIILSLIVFLFRKEMVKFIALGSVAISGIGGLIAFVAKVSGNWDDVQWVSLNWIVFKGSNSPELIIQTDSLGIFMAFIASFLGMLIAIFSVEYMKGDKHEAKYWIFLQLFIVGMDLLVLAGDLILLFVGWEIVGLCSFALISHYYYKDGEDGRKAAASGIKAFVFTHIADAGFLIAMIIIYNHIGSLTFIDIQQNSGLLNNEVVLIVGLSLFISAIGKSALFPFTPWLSSPESVDIDAMQGPTTVSALIHAATMVKAGVYLVSRIFILFPEIDIDFLKWVIVVVPAITAVITALSALVSYDLKRILAYSTVSQLSYMFLAVGLAIIASDEVISMTAFLSGQFHLISHAFFKSLLFLTAGYVIHSWHSRDIRDLKGVAHWETDKIAAIGFIIGGLSLSGIPPFIGFFSKETIIGISYEIGFHEHNSLGILAFYTAVITAIITAMYVGRMLYYLIFAKRIEGTKNHDYPLMKYVIVLLSTLTAIGGLMMLVLPSYFEDLGAGKLSFGTGDELLVSLGVSVLVILTLYFTIYLYRQNTIINNIKSNIIIVVIKEIADNGFFVDWIWQAVWATVKDIAYRMRKIHTGDLNFTMFLVAMMSFGVTIVLIGG